MAKRKLSSSPQPDETENPRGLASWLHDATSYRLREDASPEEDSISEESTDDSLLNELSSGPKRAKSTAEATTPLVNSTSSSSATIRTTRSSSTTLTSLPTQNRTLKQATSPGAPDRMSTAALSKLREEQRKPITPPQEVLADMARRRSQVLEANKRPRFDQKTKIRGQTKEQIRAALHGSRNSCAPSQPLPKGTDMDEEDEGGNGAVETKPSFSFMDVLRAEEEAGRK